MNSVSSITGFDEDDLDSQPRAKGKSKKMSSQSKGVKARIE